MPPKRKKREAARRFFQKLDHTKEWAENNYYHLPIEQQLAELVTVNDFWADYAAARRQDAVPVEVLYRKPRGTSRR